MIKRILVICFCLTPVILHGANEPAFGWILPSDFEEGSTVNVFDSRFNYMLNYPNWVNEFYNYKIKNRLIISIDETSDLFLDPYSRTIVVKVTGNGLDEDNQDVMMSEVKTFTIDYNPGIDYYKDKFVYEFEGMLNIEAEILEINADGQPSSSPGNIYLEVNIDVERYYKFDPSIPSQEIVSHTAIDLDDTPATYEELEIHWDYIPGAEEYDLEWTYVNDYDETGYLDDKKLPSELSYDFRNNATRITTSAQFYRIPLTFERGYILYRLRCVGRHWEDITRRFVGPWTSENISETTVDQYPDKFYVEPGVNSDPQASLNISNVVQDINWQHITNYAEEGKRKETLSFMDGGMKGRQMITLNSTDNVAVVGQDIYNSQGQVGVNVLPAPAGESILKYYKEFNRNMSDDAYSMEDIEDISISIPGELDVYICDQEANGMSTTDGSSRYYSPENDLLDDPDQPPHTDYIPDAQLFPFTHTAYKHDQTGRISMQGGVGPDHQYYEDGTGHETQYLYGDAEQPELDKLFGGNVGNNSHYRKNATVDANGQISISYMDMQDRVIATSLAGASPGNLKPLWSDDPEPVQLDLLGESVTVDILNKDDLYNGGEYFDQEVDDPFNNDETYDDWDDDWDNNELQDAQTWDENTNLSASEEFIAYPEHYHTIDYTLIGATFYDVCVDPMPGVYDLTLRLVDECGSLAVLDNGEEVLNITDVIGDAVINGEPAEFILDPSAEHVFDLGEYKLEKIISVNAEALEYYTDYYMDENNNSCLEDYEYFFDSLEDIYMDELLDCYITNELEFAGTYSLCKLGYELMKIDMSPGGQYAGTEPDAMMSELPFLSIYNPDNVLCDDDGNQASWKNPITRYEHPEGTKSYVPVLVAYDGDDMIFSPEVDDEMETCLEGGICGDIDIGETYECYWDTDYPEILYIEPQYLKNYSDFEFSWKDDWVLSLIQYHPEYEYYESCRDYFEFESTETDPIPEEISSDDFDQILQSINTWEEASSTDNDLGANLTELPDDPFTGLMFYDPFFFGVDNYGLDLASEMEDVLTNTGYMNSPFNMYQLASFSIKCGSCMEDDDPYSNCSPCAIDNYCTTFGAVCDEFTDEEKEILLNNQWNLFKTMYLSYKQKLQQAREFYYVTEGITEQGCKLNVCIGDENFTVADYNQYFIYSECEPCNFIYYHFYANKQKRFITGNDIVNINDYDIYEDFESVMEALEGMVNYSAYILTGQCPFAQYTQNLINGIRQKHPDDFTEISTLQNFASANMPAFNVHIYSYLLEQDNQTVPPANPVYYHYSSVLTDYVLTIDIIYSDDIPPPVPPASPTCNIVLNFPQDDFDFELDILQGFKNLQYVSEVSGVYYFDIQADILEYIDENTYVPQTIVLENCNTCFPVGGCSADDFPGLCMPNNVAVDIANLMSVLAEQGDLTSTGYDIGNETLTETIFNQNLFAYLEEDGGNNTWYWIFDGTETFTIRTNTANPSDYNQLTIELEKPTELTSFDDVIYFENIMPNEDADYNISITAVTSSTNEFTMDGLVQIAPPGGSPYDFTMGDCDVDFLPCNGPEYDLRDDLNFFFQQMIDGTNGGFLDYVDLSYNEYFTDEMKLAIGYGLQYFWDVGGADQNVYELDILIHSPDEEPYDRECNIHLEILNDNPAFTFAGIHHLGLLSTDGTPLEDGQSYNFSIVAYNGADEETADQVLISGSSECFPIKDCPYCLPGEEELGEELVLNGDFDFGSDDWTLSPNVDISDESSFCSESSDNAAHLLIYQESPSNYREYIETELDKTYLPGQCCMEPGRDYEVRFKLSLYYDSTPRETCKLLAVSGIGIYFSETVINIGNEDNILLNYDPQIDVVIEDVEYYENNCVEIVRTYTANGGEEFITIGHFLDDDYFTFMDPESGQNCEKTLDVYLVVDDVSIIPVECLALEDIEINPIEIDVADTDCEDMIIGYIESNAWNLYVNYLDSVEQDFQEQFIQKCLLEATEQFERTYHTHEYHYTLYYYDQAGNLVQTVPPKGVDIDTDPEPPGPDHTYNTNYKYNSLNQPVWQNSPDGGISKFWYNKKGQLVASQNAKQVLATSNVYSYTKYDEHGRIIEVGEMDLGTPLEDDPFHGTLNDEDYPDNLIPDPQYKTQVTHTYYDYHNPNLDEAEIEYAFGPDGQENLRNRVSSIIYAEDGNVDNYLNATHYTYDFHGNVKTLVQEINELLPDIGDSEYGHRFKKMKYEYDLVSGNVLQVSYQEGEPDQFYHRYEYDADNRITNVYTSTDEALWDLDAEYFYYQHGPLARVELANHKAQGLDYFYTLQGWLKGVNITDIDPATDIGSDGLNNPDNIHKFVGSDEYAMALGYYDTDYSTIGSGIDLGGLYSGVWDNISTERQLYNGNIGFKINDIAPTQEIPSLLAAGYNYDQLNRITKADVFDYDGTFGLIDGYGTTYSFDGNGNIKTLTRKDKIGNVFDHLTYHLDNANENNRLRFISDYATSYDFDISNQDAENYDYDGIGNLVQDNSEKIADIEWTVYGKVKKVIRWDDFCDKPDLEFVYDGAGNRIIKIVKPRIELHPSGQMHWEYTYYIRDAQGNILATYELNQNGAADNLYLKENVIYGSSRVGVKNRDKFLGSNSGFVPPEPEYIEHDLGNTRYELTNHLGNVHVVISDKKIAVDEDPADGVIDYYEADVKSWQDYYPFGMLQPGRNYQGSDSYLFGFNGQEKDDEWTGQTGSHLDFGARIYDSRLGRFLSVDPLFMNYIPISPYAFCINNPIIFIDVNGEWIQGADGKPVTYAIKDGIIEWSANATEDIKRLGETMLKVPTGVEQWEKMENTDYAVRIWYKDKSPDKNVGVFNPGKTYKKMKFDTESSPSLWKFVPEGGVDLVIYEGTIDDYIKYAGLDKEGKIARGKYMGLTKEEFIGTVGGHEAEHAADPKNIRLSEDIEMWGEDIPWGDVEEAPEKVSEKMTKEYKEKQKEEE